MAKLTDGIRGGGGSDIKPGETRSWDARDKDGNYIKTITLVRTERDYAHDLCDAYNASRSRPDILWFVTPTGELRLGDDPDWSRRNLRQIESRTETERARHNRLQLETARRANGYEREAAE
jgi:hypothetical protein